MQRQFVSYPKSGRTWIRYILTQLGLDPHIQFHHDRFEFMMALNRATISMLRGVCGSTQMSTGWFTCNATRAT